MRATVYVAKLGTQARVSRRRKARTSGTGGERWSSGSGVVREWRERQVLCCVRVSCGWLRRRPVVLRVWVERVMVRVVRVQGSVAAAGAGGLGGWWW